tara:strand:+ start:4411 stop:5568 length:1158 start_codon:yes stop_codon:yes gene_type:complete
MNNLPTLLQLYTTILADLEAEFSTTIPLFGKNVLRIIASVWSAKLKSQYLLLGFLQKNTFADTADSVAIGGNLERFGSVFLNRLPNPATAGKYTVQVTGDIGQVIPVNTVYKSDDNSMSPGLLFMLDTEFTLDGINIIELRALTVGVDSRLAIGNTLTLTGPIALVDDSVTVLTESVIPLTAENLEDYRELILQSVRLEPQGGSSSDYRLWGSEVQGVQEIYPYVASSEDSTVNLYVEATVVDSPLGNGVPTQAILDAVKDSIELPTVDRPSRKPITVIVNYLPIIVNEITITVNSSSIPSSSEADIETALNSQLLGVRPHVDAINVEADKNDTFSANDIIATILSVAPGSSFGSIVMTVDGVAMTEVQFLGGNIPFLDNVDFNS